MLFWMPLPESTTDSFGKTGSGQTRGQLFNRGVFAQDRGTPLTPLGVVVDLYLGYNAGVGPVTNQIDPISSCLSREPVLASHRVSVRTFEGRTQHPLYICVLSCLVLSALIARAWCVQVSNSWNVLPMSGNDTALDFLFKSQLFVPSGLPDAELKTTPYGTYLQYILTYSLHA